MAYTHYKAFPPRVVIAVKTDRWGLYSSCLQSIGVGEKGDSKRWLKQTNGFTFTSTVHIHTGWCSVHSLFSAQFGLQLYHIRRYITSGVLLHHKIYQPKLDSLSQNDAKESKCVNIY